MKLLLLFTLLTLCTSLYAQKLKPQQVIANLDQNTERYWEVAHEIWTLAELGYQEHKSSALLQQELKNAGFSVNPVWRACPPPLWLPMERVNR